jgi:ATP-dependent Clp protease ATP-binding subunit ClpX
MDKKKTGSPTDLACSFYLRQGQVDVQAAHSPARMSYICDECVGCATTSIAQEHATEAVGDVRLLPPQEIKALLDK